MSESTGVRNFSHYLWAILAKPLSGLETTVVHDIFDNIYVIYVHTPQGALPREVSTTRVHEWDTHRDYVLANVVEAAISVRCRLLVRASEKAPVRTTREDAYNLV